MSPLVALSMALAGMHVVVVVVVMVMVLGRILRLVYRP